MAETYEEVHFTNPPGRKPTRRKRQLKPPTATKSELQRGFYHGFRGLSLAARSAEVIDESEFSEMAGAYEDLVKRVPFLGYLILALAPLSVAGETWDKFTRVWSSRTRFISKPKEVIDVSPANANDNPPAI